MKHLYKCFYFKNFIIFPSDSSKECICFAAFLSLDENLKYNEDASSKWKNFSYASRNKIDINSPEILPESTKLHFKSRSMRRANKNKNNKQNKKKHK